MDMICPARVPLYVARQLGSILLEALPFNIVRGVYKSLSGFLLSSGNVI